ncbi:MAG: dihydroneopterin aldolase [Alphaproteobacteria bacterium]|jgi:dihydroneopterin aldolase|nr:dihydroneopterin aldolase [Alphaproteobacteria bacterium]
MGAAMAISRRTILFRDLVLPVSIGVHDFERQGPQRVIIDLEIELRADRPQPADDLSEVLDYDEIRAEITRIAGARHYNLQETLCRELVRIFEHREEIVRLRLSTRKPDAYDDCTVGYAIEYRADE